MKFYRAPRRSLSGLRGKLPCVAAVLLGVLSAQLTHASAGGRSSFSGNPETSGGAVCSVCHAPDGADPPAIYIFGPPTVDAGETQVMYLALVHEGAADAGVGISVNGGGELQPYDGDLHLLDGELTHVAPKPLVDDHTVFLFFYDAPNYDADITLYVAGNAADGNSDLLGDGIAAETFTFEVINGFEPPPPPEPPAEGEILALPFASGLTSPVVITHAGDSRLFVVERRGVIRIVDTNGTVQATPFLDISTSVDDSFSEMGLLGLAFHPDYATNGYFFVNYTRDPGPGQDRTRVSRFSVSGNPDFADAGSELVLMEFEQPFANHNAGDMHFGPDGYLYIASGDGGSGGDPLDAGQDTDTLLGKILRIDVDTPAGTGTGPDCHLGAQQNYSIPAGNAFNDGAGGNGCDEIFALGARNPWRFSFDRDTGAMWIADVGQNSFEEVHYLPPGSSGGLNLGWRCYEGNAPYNLTGCDLDYLSPVHTYAHSGGGCSITGGHVYRGDLYPSLDGQYFFTDFCQPSIRALSGSPGAPDHRVVLPTGTLSSPSTFGEDVDGELYVASLNAGTIHKLAAPPGC